MLHFSLLGKEYFTDEARMFIALLVYLGGGCVYQRTVMNQRGLRQLPNYSMWAGIFGFLVVRHASTSLANKLLTFPGHGCNPDIFLRPFAAWSARIQ
jgi:hypothetical protein